MDKDINNNLKNQEPSGVVSRLEIISQNGREHVVMLEQACRPVVHYQDGGSTMKIFLRPVEGPDE